MIIVEMTVDLQVGNTLAGDDQDLAHSGEAVQLV